MCCIVAADAIDAPHREIAVITSYRDRYDWRRLEDEFHG
jgi:hypothetical protein